MTNASFEADWIDHVLREVNTMATKHTEDPYFIIGYTEQALRGASRAIRDLGDRDLLAEGPLTITKTGVNEVVPPGRFYSGHELAAPSEFLKIFLKRLRSTARRSKRM